MQKIFQPHPYSTPVGILTERATDSGQPHEDWSLILEICDAINERDEGPKEAIRAIKKRLVSSAGRDNVSIWYTLLLLETCIKNCGRRFRSQVANKEFIQCFLKLLSPKNNPPQSLQTKILYMFKSWVLSNWDVSGKRDLEKIYATLIQKGIQFPNFPPESNMSGLVRNEPDIVLGKAPNMVSRPSYSQAHSSFHPTLNGRPQYTHKDTVSIDGSHSTLINGDRTLLCRSCHTHHTQETRPHITNKDPVYRPTSRHIHSSSCNPSNHHIRVIRSDQLSQNPHGMAGYVDRSVVIDSMFHRNSFVPQDYGITSSNGQNTVNMAQRDQMELDEEGTIRHLNASQKIKLNEDLAVVETNINLLNDLLAELRPDTVTDDDLNLLHELNATCRVLHQRVMIFLSQVSDEEVTPALIQVNDNLNNALSRYERFEHYHARALRGSDSNLNSSRSATRSGMNPAIDGGESRLAITAGPLSHSNQSYRNRTTREDSTQNHLHDNDDDDDDSLLDLSDIPTLTGPNQQIDETDEIAQWLASRQLIAVSRANLSLPSSSTKPVVQTARNSNTLALIPVAKQDSRSNTHRPTINGQSGAPTPCPVDALLSATITDNRHRRIHNQATETNKDLVKF